VTSANLLDVSLRDAVLNPALADVRITFTLRQPVAGLEIRSRLMGPRCRYASTVEVAYPFRMLPTPEDQACTVAARVIIPEPSLWEPTCPFLYEGPVELWGKEGRRDGLQIRHGLRWFRLTPRGLLWNDRPLALRGVARDHLDEGEAAPLRAVGCNTLLTAAADRDTLEVLLDSADRLGFLVLARLPAVPDPRTWTGGLAEHVSLLGWVLPPEVIEQGPGALAPWSGLGPLLGVELSQPVPEERLTGISFVYCREELLPELGGVGRHRVVLAARAPEQPSVLGWISP
jgi:hypothetical protein